MVYINNRFFHRTHFIQGVVLHQACDFLRPATPTGRRERQSSLTASTEIPICVAPLIPLRRQFISRARTRNTRSTGRSLGRRFMRPALQETTERENRSRTHTGRFFTASRRRSQNFTSRTASAVAAGGNVRISHFHCISVAGLFHKKT